MPMANIITEITAVVIPPLLNAQNIITKGVRITASISRNDDKQKYLVAVSLHKQREVH